MQNVKLAKIVAYCDAALQTDAFEDWTGAFNGLQVENRGIVRQVAAAVDANLTTCRLAVEAGANLLIAHHGLFWRPGHPWTGHRYKLIRLLMDYDLAVYSSHLPLDAHAEWGNNILICRALKLENPKPFFPCKGRQIGFRARSATPRDQLLGQLASILGDHPLLIPGGPEICRNIGVVSGGAGAELSQVAAEGIDTFITGEGPHWTHALAEELGLNVIYGGHYATETFGVKALARELELKFRLPWFFVEHPTGL